MTLLPGPGWPCEMGWGMCDDRGVMCMDAWGGHALGVYVCSLLYVWARPLCYSLVSSRVQPLTEELSKQPQVYSSAVRHGSMKFTT